MRLGTGVAVIYDVMRVRLTRKYADRIDGVNLRGCEVGDVLDLTPSDARMLLAERWAVPAPLTSERPRQPQVEDAGLDRAS